MWYSRKVECCIVYFIHDLPIRTFINHLNLSHDFVNDTMNTKKVFITILTIKLIMIAAYPLGKLTLDTGVRIEKTEHTWGNSEACSQQNKTNNRSQKSAILQS